MALACVKQAAAIANSELGLLDDERADAIVAACEEIRAGALHDQFVVDVIQGGAGTSTNMNANEVIANRALELLGHRKGEYAAPASARPRQPGAEHQRRLPDGGQARAAARASRGCWLAHGRSCAKAFAAKATEFADVLKMGRTQLQDAVPMTLGQEFSAYAVMLGEDVAAAAARRATLIREINLGATAIGTGINAHPDYAALVCDAPVPTITGHAAGHRRRTWSRRRRTPAPSCSSPACSSASR